MDTREWSDGVLTNAARQVVREPIDVQSWIVCDGDIDPGGSSLSTLSLMTTDY